MEMESVRRALQETARRHGVTEEQVVLEIESAIEAAISQAGKEGNQKVLDQWEKMKCKDRYPNAYELVAYIGEKITAD